MESQSITTTITYAALVLLPLILLLSIRTFSVLQQTKSNRTKKTYLNTSKRTRPVKTLAVLGSGGHTTEMLRLLSSISTSHHDQYQPLNYIIAATDTTSQNRIDAFQKITPNSPPPHSHIFEIPRAREVGQSYFTSIFTTLHSILYTAHIVLLRTRPDVLIVNGPGTCIPVVLWTFVGRVLGLCEGKIIFCESFCRVKTLSLTGNILWKMGIVDLFLVHWPEILEKINGGNDGMILMDSFIRH